MRGWWLTFLALVACRGSSETPCEGAHCVDAGTPPPTCAAFELPTVGGCKAIGVPVDGCASGFRHDGEGGCLAVLPSAACPKGELAIPGDTACHPVGACGTDPWGGVADSPSTLHVDGSGPPSGDGSRAKPFLRISEAIAAAKAGSIVAVASGTYTEDLVISRAIELVGRCPSMVHVKGVTGRFAVEINAVADVHGLSITGPKGGVRVTKAMGARLRELHVHDVGTDAAVQIEFGEATVSGVLVEGAKVLGVLALDSTLTFEGSLVRDAGTGLLSNVSFSDTFTKLQVRRSVFERLDLGVSISDTDGIVEGSVFRDLAMGVNADNHQTRPGDAQVLTSTFDRCRSTAVQANQTRLGVVRSTARASRRGITSYSADLTVEECTIRDGTGPGKDAPQVSFGILVASSGAPRSALVRSTIVSRMLNAGVFVAGSNMLLDSCLVSKTLPREDGLFGDGISVYPGTTPAPFDGLLRVTGSASLGNARAGVAIFATSVRLEGSVLRCNAFELDATRSFYGAAGKLERDFALEDGEGNTCGCEKAAACKVQSSGLEPARPPSPP